MGRRNGYWPTHPKKELQAVLMRFHEQDWLIEKGKGYYSVKCSCEMKHKTMVHLSPSNPNYAKDKLGLLRRAECYKEDRER